MKTPPNNMFSIKSIRHLLRLLYQAFLCRHLLSFIPLSLFHLLVPLFYSHTQMAVQAHSSANLFLPITRTLQQGTTTVQIENNATNQRKRGREDNMNQFISNARIKQSHCSRFVDANSQFELRNHVDVSTGLRLAFNDHQHVSLLSSHDLSNLINQQDDEIERYLQAQGEEVTRMLADKRQRDYYALIAGAKEFASRKIREKEAEAEKAARLHAELEAKAWQLSAEAEAWQAKARGAEAVAVALQAQLQQTIGASQGEEVAAAAREAEDAESSYVDPERVVVVSGPGCKACGKRVASVVLLPCRHLCVCSECDDVVQSCPMCLSFRSSSVEVFM